MRLTKIRHNTKVQACRQWQTCYIAMEYMYIGKEPAWLDQNAQSCAAHERQNIIVISIVTNVGREVWLTGII